MDEKELARELLIEKIKAYMNANPSKMVHKGIPSEWYPGCLDVARAIIEVSQ